jgi:hypothetical protein
MARVRGRLSLQSSLSASCPLKDAVPLLHAALTGCHAASRAFMGCVVCRFDGDAMLHAVHFRAGKALTYHSHWLRTPRFLFQRAYGGPLWPLVRLPSTFTSFWNGSYDRLACTYPDLEAPSQAEIITWRKVFVQGAFLLKTVHVRLRTNATLSI